MAADPRLARSLVVEGWPLAGTALVLLGGQQLVQLALLRLHGAEEVALLGAAQRLVEALGLLPRALMLTVLPALSRAALFFALRLAHNVTRGFKDARSQPGAACGANTI